MNIKKNDNVIILTGKDKGKEGKVLRTLPKENKLIVEGVNMVKRAQKARFHGQKGEVIEKAMPLHVSNVALKDPKSGKPTRIGFEVKDGKKIRIAKRSGEKV